MVRVWCIGTLVVSRHVAYFTVPLRLRQAWEPRDIYVLASLTYARPNVSHIFNDPIIGLMVPNITHGFLDRIKILIAKEAQDDLQACLRNPLLIITRVGLIQNRDYGTDF